MTGMDSNGGESHTDFESSFKWTQRFIPKIKEILAPRVIRVSNDKEDRTEATDLLTLRADGLRIACRVRRPGYSDHPQFRQEVTITFRRETGSACEYDKMIKGGWGDWFFYAHAPDLVPRVLIDLARARPLIIDLVKRGVIKESAKPNKDRLGRRCWFLPIPIPLIQPSVLAHNDGSKITEIPTEDQSQKAFREKWQTASDKMARTSYSGETT